MAIKRLCVFCGSSEGNSPEVVWAAEDLGGLLAARDIGLVYGGGRIGLMGRLADSALAAGGRVHGVIPGFLKESELGHSGLTDLVVVDSMHERKAKMAELSNAFAALPGGFGTLDEIFEVLTWAQLGLHGKPCAFLNVNGFFDPLLSQLASASDRGFISPAHLKLLLVARTPAELVEKLFGMRF